MRTSEQSNEIFSALIAAQSEIKPAVKDSVNPHFKSKYADLSAVWDVCKEPLSKNHLAVIQAPICVDNKVGVITRVIHKSGQWIETELALVPRTSSPQDAGSCISYARRYSIGSLLGVITEEDDDGNKASGHTPNSKGSAQSPVKKDPRLQTMPEDPKVWPKYFDKENQKALDWIATKIDTIPAKSHHFVIKRFHGHPVSKEALDIAITLGLQEYDELIRESIN